MTNKLQAPALDPTTIERVGGSVYPKEHASVCEGRSKARIGNELGLNNFGVNYVCLEPGSASSQRHWHHKQDEFIYIIQGELTLVTDAGEQILQKGMVAGFPAGKEDGHQLINRSDSNAFYLEVGDRTPGDGAEYPDIDLRVSVDDAGFHFVHKDGAPYDKAD